MKHYFTILILFCIFSKIMAASLYFQNTVESNNPNLYYKFNEVDGIAVNYGSWGSDYNANYNGNVVRGVSTLSGDSGVSFTGVNDYIESLTTAPTSMTGNPNFSIEALFFVPQGATASQWPTFLHWGGPYAGNSVFFGLNRNENNRIYSGFYSGGKQMSDPFSLGSWHHVVMIREGGSNNAFSGIRVFFDGVEVPIVNSLSYTGAINLTSTTFKINRATDSIRYYTGSIDELALYDRILTETDVVNHYNALFIEVPEPGTLALTGMTLIILFFHRKH